MAKTIGIVGGGQLGRMLTEAAHKLGFSVAVLDPTPESPAGQVADEQIVADFKNTEKIVELASDVDFLTFEIELADAEILAALAKTGAIVNPTGETLKLIKNKYEQKLFLQERGIPLGEFTYIDGLEDGIAAGETFGYPFVLKACLDSYDGRGNVTVENKDDVVPALARFAGRKRYAEKWIPFKKELAVMVARDMQGNIKTYPTTHTIHKDHICHTTITPADIPSKVDEKAQQLARNVIESFSGAGVFGIEMFLTEKGEVLLNEVAPRVHNSGHYTIEGCVVSQFEQHIRCIADMELADTSMKVPFAVMINILGDRSGPAEPKGIKEAEALGNVSVYIYGKHEVRPQRKMGHITVTADTRDEAHEKAKEAGRVMRI